MNKSVFLAALVTLPIAYGLVYAGGPTWAVVGLFVLLGLVIFNAIAYFVLAAYWIIFAKLSEDNPGNLESRLGELFKERTERGEDPSRQRTLLGMVQVGTATFKVLNAHLPTTAFLNHIAISAIIFLAAWTSGYQVAAAVFLLVEVVSYNCIYWLSKHSQQIKAEVEQAIALLEASLND